MKKILISLLLVLFSFSVCFAETEQVYEPLEPIIPAYVATNDVDSVLQISSGKATYHTLLIPKPGKTVTKVVATMKLVNSKGTVVQSKTATLYIEIGRFKISNSKVLSTRGTYHVESVLKVYNGTKLIETIYNKSGEETY